MRGPLGGGIFGGSAPAPVFRSAVANWFRGTGINTPTGGVPDVYLLHDPEAYATVASPSSEVLMPVEAVPQSIAGGTPPAVAVFIGSGTNGLATYYGQTLFDGAAGVKQVKNIALPATAKTVYLVEIGAYITGITSSYAPTPRTAPLNTLCIFGDSICVGYMANPVALGWACLYRFSQTYFDEIINFSRAGQLLASYNAPYGGIGFPALATQILTRCTGSVSRSVYSELGINDYSGPPVLDCATNFAVFQPQLYDLIHAGDASVRVYSQSVGLTTLEATANTSGDTPTTYRNANTATCAARAAWTTPINGATILAPGNAANLADTVHPNAAGMVAMRTNIAALLPT